MWISSQNPHFVGICVKDVLWGWWRSMWFCFLPVISLISGERWKEITATPLISVNILSLLTEHTIIHSPQIFLCVSSGRKVMFSSPFESWPEVVRGSAPDIVAHRKRNFFFFLSVVIHQMSFTGDTSIFHSLTIKYYIFTQLLFYTKSFYSFFTTNKIWVVFRYSNK